MIFYTIGFLLLALGASATNARKDQIPSATVEIFKHVTLKVVHNLKVGGLEKSDILKLLDVNPCTATKIRFHTSPLEAENDGKMMTDKVVIVEVVLNCNNVIPNGPSTTNPPIDHYEKRSTLWRIVLKNILKGTDYLFERYFLYLFILFVALNRTEIYNSLIMIQFFHDAAVQAIRAFMRQFFHRWI